MADPITPQDAPSPNAQPSPTAGLRFALPEKAVQIIQQAESEKGLPPGALMGLFAAENSGHANLKEAMLARSPTGPRGPFQLTAGAITDTGRDPKTFQWGSLRENALTAADYANKLLEQTSDVPAHPLLRIAGGFNLGPGRMKAMLASGELDLTPEGFDKASESVGNGKYITKFQKATPIDMTMTTTPGTQAQVPGVTASSVATPQDRAKLLAQEEQRLMQPPGGGPATAQNALGAVPGLAQSLGQAAWEGLIQPAAETMLQLPTELAQNVTAGAQRVGQGIDALTGVPHFFPPGESQVPFTPIDPVGAVNFGATLFSPAGRLASAGTNMGVGVLNAAESAAREEATQQQIDWNDLPLGDRLSRMANKLDYDTMSQQLPAIVGGTLFGGLLAPRGAYQGKISRAKDAAQDAWQTAKNAVDEHNAPIIAHTQERDARDMWKYAIKEKGERESVQLYNQEQTLASKADAEAADAYAKAKLRTDQQIAKAEGLTGKTRLPEVDAEWELNLQKQNQELRDYLLHETGLGPPETRLEDPSRAVFDSWIGTWDAPTEAAMRELPDTVKDDVNGLLDKVAKEARKSGRAEGPIGKLPRLGDAKLDQDIADLEYKISGLEPGSSQVGPLYAQLEMMYDQRKPVTIKDVVDLVQNVDAGRRTKLFTDSATDREKALLSDLSSMLRREDGVVEQALGPDDAAIWRQGNVLSRDWNERKRITDIVSDAFMDIKPGAATVRNNLYAGREKYINSLGQARYDRLYELAGAVDDLYLKIPPPPKPSAKPLKTYVPGVSPLPRDPTTAKGFRAHPDKPGPDDYKSYMEAERASSFIRSLNEAFRHGQYHAVGSVAGAGMAGAYASRHNQDPATAIMIGSATLGTLLAVPAAGRAFATVMRHWDHPESRAYAQSVAKLLTIAQMQDAYKAQQPAANPVAQAPLALPPNPPSARMPVPNMPTRPTGGPVPAPAASPSGGTPRVLNMQPLR